MQYGVPGFTWIANALQQNLLLNDFVYAFTLICQTSTGLDVWQVVRRVCTLGLGG
jgi:hypothetical protein